MPQLSFDVTPEENTKLKEIADLNKRSVRQQVAIIVQEYIGSSVPSVTKEVARKPTKSIPFSSSNSVLSSLAKPSIYDK